MLEIRGDYLEGGGSVIRLAVALSVISQKPIKVFSIRKSRKKPGLKTQHLRAIEAVSRLCDGKLKNAFLGSEEIEFYPGEIRENKLDVRIETAGSCGLLLQCVMPVCFFSKNRVEVDIKGGGTFNKWAPCVLYLQNVLLPMIKKLGFSADIEVMKEGFYPKGGAVVKLRTKPVKDLKKLNLVEQGKLKQIRGVSIASRILEKAKVVERTAKAARSLLNFKVPIKIDGKYVDSLCAGSGILLFAEFKNCILGYDVVGERGKLSERIGEEASLGLLKQIKSCATVDEFMSDQILIYLALSGKGSVVRVPKISKHARTNMWLIEKFLGVRFKIAGNLVSII